MEAILVSIWWLGMAAMTAWVASSKGRRVAVWVWLGLGLGIFGLIAASLSSVAQSCRYCLSPVDASATVCRHCGRDVARAAPAAVRARGSLNEPSSTPWEPPVAAPQSENPTVERWGKA